MLAGFIAVYTVCMAINSGIVDFLGDECNYKLPAAYTEINPAARYLALLTLTHSYSLARSCTHSLTHLLIYSPTHSLLLTFVPTHTHLLTYSYSLTLTHSLTQVR